MPLPIKPERFREWARLCADSLGTVRAEIDGINVFPVADADTGTNAFLTFRSAHEAVSQLPVDAGLDEVLRVYGDELLMAAQGNCGTILSELVRGSLRVLRQHGSISPESVDAAFAAASAAAYAAVGEPREGTILSVGAAAARGARQAHLDGCDAREVFDVAAQAARRALLDTPLQLEVLARAGVVDAGGRALVAVLDATSHALTGRVPPPFEARRVRFPAGVVDDELSPDGPSYEVMYLLRTSVEQIQSLRQSLLSLGDSLVVVGGEELWNIHVHVNDVGAAIEAGLAVGTPFRIKVTHFAEQTRRRAPRGRTVIAAVTGEGLARLVSDSGAMPMRFDDDHPLTVDAMVRALGEVTCDEVIVLPNREEHIAQFEAAAKVLRDRGSRVAVLPTTVQVEGLAALAVHDEHVGFDDAVIAMSSAAGHTRHGAVTVATSDGLTMAGPCRAGDVLGVVDGDFSVVGSSVTQVAIDVLAALDARSADLVTLVRGDGFESAELAAVRDHVADTAHAVDVVEYDGGQSGYVLFIAVE